MRRSVLMLVCIIIAGMIFFCSAPLPTEPAASPIGSTGTGRRILAARNNPATIGQARACPVPAVRQKNTLYVALVGFGERWMENDLQQNKQALERYFPRAMNQGARLEVVATERVDLDEVPAGILAKYKQKYPWLSENSIRRIRYLDGGGQAIVAGVTRGLRDKQFPVSGCFDAIVVVSEAQFKRYSFRSGNYLFVESPSELSWDSDVNYRLERGSEWYIADLATHELGDWFGVPGPKRDQCTVDRQADIMSLCHDARRASSTHAHMFSDAARRKILEELSQMH